jgi:hypothetical protein
MVVAPSAVQQPNTSQSVSPASRTESDSGQPGSRAAGAAGGHHSSFLDSSFLIPHSSPVQVVPTIEQAPPPELVDPPSAAAAVPVEPSAPPDDSPAPAKHVAEDICSRHGGRRVDYRSSNGRAMWRCVYH